MAAPKEKMVRLSGYVPESVKDKVAIRAEQKHNGKLNQALIELINRGDKEINRKRSKK